MDALTDSRLVWVLGLLALYGVVRALRSFGAPALEVVDIAIRGEQGSHPSDADLVVREKVRLLVEGLRLGRASSLGNAKTGAEFMHVWLYVPRGADAMAPLQQALEGYPVSIKILGPPVDMSGEAVLRRGVPLIWRALVQSWHDTKRP